MKNDIIKAKADNGDRLYVVVSPNEMNTTLNTIIISPLVITKRHIPTQILIKASAKSGLQTDCYLALDQLTTIEKAKVILKIGEISEAETAHVAIIFQEMFAL